MIKFFNLFFCIVINITLCSGLDKSPEIKRVCLDYNTSTATIYWEQINDICNSFQKNILYSSENEGPWVKIIEISNKNITEYSYTVSNITSIWKYKIVSYFACNNTDSFYSSSVYVDKTPPANIEIDSISFDMNSQNIIIGWTSNPSPDVKGYKIYKYYNSVNDFISYSYIPSISLSSYNLNNPEYFSIASFDSCNLYSLISSAHKASYLNNVYDSCKKSIQLTWTNYEGWSNTKTYLVVNKNNNGFKYLIDVTGLNTYNYKHLSSDTKICIYIRTVNKSNNFTSSSNTVCVNTKKDLSPSYIYLSNVTVDDNRRIQITVDLDPVSTTDSIVLYKYENGNKYFKSIKNTKNQSHYEIWDENVNVNIQSYQYIAKSINTCKDTLMISNNGKSILLINNYLSNTDYLLKWNKYSNWQNGISSQEVQYSYNNTSWITLSNSNYDIYQFDLNNLIEDFDSVCFRVINKEKISSYNTENSSISNALCAKKNSKYYFPQSINPLTNNNVFKVYGNNLDILESEFDIFNRWGQRIFHSKDIKKGWDFKIDEIPVDLGTYFFKVYIRDKNNNSNYFSGTILVIY